MDRWMEACRRKWSGREEWHGVGWMEKSIRVGQGTGKSSVGGSQRKDKELLPVVVVVVNLHLLDMKMW